MSKDEFFTHVCNSQNSKVLIRTDFLLFIGIMNVVVTYIYIIKLLLTQKLKSFINYFKTILKFLKFCYIYDLIRRIACSILCKVSAVYY